MSYDLRALSDDELLRRLSALLGQSRRIEWELVAHIGEVEQRRLFAREACDSMFVYCTDTCICRSTRPTCASLPRGRRATIRCS